MTVGGIVYQGDSFPDAFRGKYIAGDLLGHGVYWHDPRLPLLWWWAVERHSVDGRDEVLRRFLRPALWKSKLGRETLLPRLIRRYASEGNSAGLDAVVQLLKAAPDDTARSSLWLPVLQGWQDRPCRPRRHRRSCW